MNKGKGGKTYQVKDLIVNPRDERKKQADRKRIEASKDELRQLAKDKGLEPNF